MKIKGTLTGIIIWNVYQLLWIVMAIILLSLNDVKIYGCFTVLLALSPWLAGAVIRQLMERGHILLQKESEGT